MNPGSTRLINTEQENEDNLDQLSNYNETQELLLLLLIAIILGVVIRWLRLVQALPPILRGKRGRKNIPKNILTDISLLGLSHTVEDIK